MLGRFASRFALVAMATTLLGACATAAPPRERVYVRVAPPPARVEVVGRSPGPGYVWVKGYYRWNGAAYRWVPGHWAVRERGARAWVAGRWAHDRYGWYWVEGHWR
jgi:hypothetical protein